MESMVIIENSVLPRHVLTHVHLLSIVRMCSRRLTQLVPKWDIYPTKMPPTHQGTSSLSFIAHPGSARCGTKFYQRHNRLKSHKILVTLWCLITVNCLTIHVFDLVLNSGDTIDRKFVLKISSKLYQFIYGVICLKWPSKVNCNNQNIQQWRFVKKKRTQFSQWKLFFAIFHISWKYYKLAEHANTMLPQRK